MTSSERKRPGLKRIRPSLVVVSSSIRGNRFAENQGDYLWTDENIPLPLQLHYHPIDDRLVKAWPPRGDGRPVLILHGASAGADTFLAPRHGGCLVDHLIDENYEPWLLDWRASKDVAETIALLCSPIGDHEERDVDQDRLHRVPDEIRQLYEKDGEKVFEQLNFNNAAKYDIRRALEAIAYLRPGKPIDVIAHCMGGAAMAEALLRGVLVDDENKGEGVGRHLSHVVLSTIGVFYQMNLHGRLKAESQLLGVLQAAQRHFVDPRPLAPDPDQALVDTGLDPKPPLREPWPEDVETLYRAWRVPYDERRFEDEGIPEDERPVFEMFNRLSFMFGEPYQEGHLAPEIHHCLQALTVERMGSNPLESVRSGAVIESGGERVGEAAYDFDPEQKKPLLVFRCRPDLEIGQALFADGRLIGKLAAIEAGEGPLLPELFGGMSVDLFRHGADNLRVGMATELGEGADGSVSWLQRAIEKKTDPYEHFRALDRLTLIGGGLNRLWHRDCIDRMADWLSRSPEIRGKCQKEMLLDYGHQDLFWGRDAARVVFPKIVAGLGPRPSAPEDQPEPLPESTPAV